MAVTAKTLIPSQQLTNANLTYYTAAGVRTIIDKFTVCNTTGGAVTVTVDLVNAGAAAGVTQRAISARSIPAGSTYTCPEIVGHVLNDGDTIQGLAGSNSALTVRASGREIT